MLVNGAEPRKPQEFAFQIILFSFPLGSPASLEGLSEFKLSDLTDLLLVQRLEDLDSAPF